MELKQVAAQLRLLHVQWSLDCKWVTQKIEKITLLLQMEYLGTQIVEGNEGYF